MKVFYMKEDPSPNRLNCTFTAFYLSSCKHLYRLTAWLQTKCMILNGCYLLHGRLYDNCYDSAVLQFCTWCKMEHQHILRFLSVHGLTTILLVGRLGVENEGHGLHKLAITLHVIYFCRVSANEQVCLWKPRAHNEMKQWIPDTFAAVDLGYF